MSVGIKETKEALVAVNEISLHIVSRIKQGIVSDVLGLLSDLQNDVEFKAKLQAGFDNVTAVPSEVADISVAEGLELVAVEIAYVPKFLSALVS